MIWKTAIIKWRHVEILTAEFLPYRSKNVEITSRHLFTSRKSVRLTDPIFRKLTVAPRPFVKKQNTKFYVNSRNHLSLTVGHRQTKVFSTYGATCNFANSAWKCHYVTNHRHQFLDIVLARQRIRIASLLRKFFHATKKSNQETVFVRFWLPNLITEDF